VGSVGWKGRRRPFPNRYNQRVLHNTDRRAVGPGILVIYVLGSLSQKTISKSDLITVIHYTTCRICEHRHVMHYTTHRICEHSHVMQHTLPSAEPLVRKFSPLSPLITTGLSSLSYNYPSFHAPIPTSREPQPSAITIPGFLQPVIVVRNIPNWVLPSTHI